MVKGAGIDIIEIARIRKALKGHRGFLERIFAPEEIQYYRKRKMNVASIAGGFAAKEAVMKALGTGLRSLTWKEIRIMRDGLGKPVVVLKGNAKEIADGAGIQRILVSIAHCRSYAAAQAVALGGAEYESCNP